MFPLDSDLKQFLTDLVIEQNAPGGWLPSDDVLSLMIESIEDALIDAESLEPILEFLNALPSNKALERSESVFENDEDLMVAVENGLGALYRHSPVLFFASVVDPFALMELRDNIYEVLSPYWWEKIQHGGGREPRSPDEIWDEAMEEAGLIRKEVTAFDPSDGPRRWKVRAAADQVVRIAPVGEVAPSVEVEFSLKHFEGWQLEVRLVDPFPSTGSRRDGRLIGVDGSELGRVDDEANEMIFTIDHPDTLRGAELICDDRRNGGAHFQFRVAVNLP